MPFKRINEEYSGPESIDDNAFYFQNNSIDIDDTSVTFDEGGQGIIFQDKNGNNYGGVSGFQNGAEKGIKLFTGPSVTGSDTTVNNLLKISYSGATCKVGFGGGDLNSSAIAAAWRKACFGNTTGVLPVAQGGTGAATATKALPNIMAGKVVAYNNTAGTTGMVTLSYSTANYNRMRIFFKNVDGIYGSVEVYSPNGKSFSIDTVRDAYSNGSHVGDAAVMYIGNSAISKSSYGQYQYGGETGVNNNNTISIVRVEMWNDKS